MLEKIRSFPQHLIEGWNIGEPIETSLRQPFDHIVFCGMGGSAIAGDFVRIVFQKDIHKPFIVNRQYHIPSFADTGTIALISSYSGNTEESLSSLKDAESRKCKIICLTSGGQLKKIANERGYPLFCMPEGFPPRAALGYTIGILLRIFHDAEIGHINYNSLKSVCVDIQKYLENWRDAENSNNFALKIAQKLHKRIPIIYGSTEITEPISLRWKTQLNENSKVHAFCHNIPEMNHNEIMGWEQQKATKSILKNYIPILIHSSLDSSRIKMRMEILQKLFHETNVDMINIHAEGNSVLYQLVYLAVLGDMISFWLAMLNEVDPTEIRNIQRFKNMLTEI